VLLNKDGFVAISIGKGSKRVALGLEGLDVGQGLD